MGLMPHAPQALAQIVHLVAKEAILVALAKLIYGNQPILALIIHFQAAEIIILIAFIPPLLNLNLVHSK